ncbi:MAG: hypothetical protein A2V66_14645 [Ignavibacteria bacterium RBG_13_36_8]|nr:MAG: hypothetical protein A2V66_14645 [Ignavibacteria bacterium RBG_13_36_8]
MDNIKSKTEKKSFAVSIRNVSYSYDDNRKALEDIAFDIYRGETIAFIGPNGAGKSTLLSLLNGVRKCDGEIYISGILICKDTMSKIRSLVGLVFQNPDDQLFCPTIFEDVIFGPLNQGLSKEEAAKKVVEALHEVGLPGYESRSSFHLSYGERKLASIATVLAMSPDIIALDEPTSNLDPCHRRKIINWIKRNRNKTIVIATHDLDMVAETCNRVHILNYGKIVTSGKTKEILTNADLLVKNGLELPLSLQKAGFLN